MIKLAFLIRKLDVGGAQRQLIALVKALDKNKFDVTVLTFYSGGILEKDLKNTSIKLISLEKKGRWDVWGFVRRLVHNLNNIQPDLLHGYLSTSNILTILLKPLFTKTKIIWGVRSSNQDFSYYNWLSGVSFKLECWLSSFVDLIINNSYSGKNYHLKQGFPSEKMVVIPNGIDTERFHPDLDARTKIRQEWKVSDNTIIIALVARYDPKKGHKTFLEAAALMSKENPNVFFVCVGTGSQTYTREIYQLSEELMISDRLIWAGARDDMSVLYNAFDIVCSSSSFGEGFANVVGEAMACGIPCVVTDVGDSAWIVGDIGPVVSPKNPQALAKAWKSCMERDKKEISVQSRLRIIEHFSVQELANQTEKLLEKFS